MTSTLLQILFWLGLAYLVYVEVGYLLLLFVLSKFKRPAAAPPQDFEPSLTLLLAAYNEEAVIRARLENLLAQDYPAAKLQIVVASDQSSDRTDAIVQEYASRGVLLCRARQHAGKIAALRDAEPHITGQVVVFTDADAMFQPRALRLLARHFADPTVGAVSGRETRPGAGPAGQGRGEGLYNRIETLAKTLESQVGSQVLLHGGIFAMRRELLPYVPDHLTHDATVPLELVLKGYRVLYEPQATTVEAYHLDSRQDWARRIRTVAQAYQSYLYVKDALNPIKTGFYALQVCSHRFMRWFVFPVLVLVGLSSLLLWGQAPIYRLLVAAQGFCYALAFVGFLLDRAGKRPFVFYFPFYFVYIHLAAIYAIWLTWRGQKVTTWRTARMQTGD